MTDEKELASKERRKIAFSALSRAPEFHYEEFEDYLFNAIQLSRNLTVDDCSDAEDVLRQLRLAISTVDNFSRESVY